jgi:hypothetical protein
MHSSENGQGVDGQLPQVTSSTPQAGTSTSRRAPHLLKYSSSTILKSMISPRYKSV